VWSGGELRDTVWRCHCESCIVEGPFDTFDARRARGRFPHIFKASRGASNETRLRVTSNRYTFDLLLNLEYNAAAAGKRCKLPKAY
jgi:hypothetical protein